MKTVMAVALLGLLTLVALSGRVEGQDDKTYVTNLSSKFIVGTMSYNFPFASSDFVNRVIAPDTYEHDEYSHEDCHFPNYGEFPTLNVELWVNGSCCHNHVTIQCDTSIVGFDNAERTGVEIYLSVYGNIATPSGSVLVTIFP